MQPSTHVRRVSRAPAVATMALLILGACRSERAAARGAPTMAQGAPNAVVAAGDVVGRAPAPDTSWLVTAPRLTSGPPSADRATQERTLRESAQTAWAFVARNYSDASGLVRAHDTYQYVTIWDVASALASYRAARDLDLITEADYRRRMDRAIATLRSMPLYANAVPNRLFDSETGRMVGRDEKPTATGYGYSATDLGRMLVILSVIAERDPAAAPAIRSLVQRYDLGRVVADGYLHGEDIPESGQRRRFQEARVGYEQYAAEGFARWGARPTGALDFRRHTEPVEVEGITLAADKRRGEHITSEPWIMMGLELGWTNPVWRAQALRVLAAQEARWKRTGTITMVSEDAIPEPPTYFYYYSVYRDGKPFVVASPTGEVSPKFPRWVSAKAAFGWHALAPSDYTWKAIQAVKWGATRGRGWTAGVRENSRESMKSYNLNTSAIVLESAAMALRGCPLIERCTR